MSLSVPPLLLHRCCLSSQAPLRTTRSPVASLQPVVLPAQAASASAQASSLSTRQRALEPRPTHHIRLAQRQQATECKRLVFDASPPSTWEIPSRPDDTAVAGVDCHTCTVSYISAVRDASACLLFARYLFAVPFDQPNDVLRRCLLSASWVVILVCIDWTENESVA